MSPRRFKPEARAAATIFGRSAELHPPRFGSVVVFTSTKTSGRAMPVDRARSLIDWTSFNRESDCQQETTGKSRGSLFRWIAPRKCHRN
jgi:hypothetical protein